MPKTTEVHPKPGTLVTRGVIVTRNRPTLERHVVELIIDERKLTELLGERATSNRTGKASVLFGAVRARHIRKLED